MKFKDGQVVVGVVELAKLLVDAVSDGCPKEMDWDCCKDKFGWDGCEECWKKFLMTQCEKEDT